MMKWNHQNFGFPWRLETKIKSKLESEESRNIKSKLESIELMTELIETRKNESKKMKRIDEKSGSRMKMTMNL